MTYEQSHISWSCCQLSKVCIEGNLTDGSILFPSARIAFDYRELPNLTAADWFSSWISPTSPGMRGGRIPNAALW
jgi:hypothetical protein